MSEEPEGWRRAVAARDARFDGRFVVGVTSTGIYCRPSCPARPPRPEHLRVHSTPASAQAAGFRACLRCRPDAAPGSPEWDLRSDLAGRAMRLIADGVVEREGVGGLARRLHVGERHLRRVLTDAVGCGPLALARAERARTARVLIETTDLPFGRVAFSAGFGSLRQFNDTVRASFGRSPTELRRTRGAPAGSGAGVVSLRLAAREPVDVAATLRFLAARAVAGVEDVRDGVLRRAVSLPHGGGILHLRAEPGGARLDARLDDLRDLPVAVGRVRRLLDLDADPEAVDAALALDPLLAPLVAATPGTRMPAGPEPFEAAVRVVAGQQVSVTSARTVLGRIVATLGEPLASAGDGPTHRFPTAEAIAACDPARLPLPAARASALVGLADSVATGRVVLDPGADRAEARAALLALPGIGPWSAEMILLRGLGDPDAFPASDLGLRRAAGAGSAAGLESRAGAWRPWRAYAAQLLWTAGAAAESRAHPRAPDVMLAA